MITSALIYLMIALASPLRALPTATLPGELSAAFASFGSTLRDLSGILPIGTLFSIVGIFITIEVAILIYKIVKLIAKR